MVPAGNLVGKLVDKGGQPVQVGISLISEDRETPNWRTEKTEKDGSLRVLGIAPGKYTLTVSQNAKFTMRPVTGITVKAMETTKVGEMVAIPGAILSGRILDADSGKPITSGQVMVSRPMTGEGLFSPPTCVQVDKQGRYKVRVYPGEYEIHYWGFGAADIYGFGNPSKTVTVGEQGLTADLKAKKADIAKGRVVDQKGKPVQDVEVTINGSHTSATTDKDGRFTAMVPPERGEESWPEPQAKSVLVAVDEKSKQGVYEWMSREELLSKGLLIRLKPARSLTLTIKGPDGKPIEGAEVRLMERVGPSYAWGPTDPVLSDENGRAVFTVYENGSYHPQATCDGYYYEADSFEEVPKVGDKDWKDTAEITMQRATRTQTGNVVDEDGNPVEGATVMFWEADKEVKTDKNGEFTIENMPDTEVGLTAMKGFVFGHASVDKDTGPVTITLKKPD